MKKTLLSLVFGFAVMSNSFAQQSADENFQSHSVQMGETVLVIAKKYKIKPRDIYEYNPSAVEGLSPNSIIQIPLHRQLQKPVAVADTGDDIPQQAVVAVATEAPVVTRPAAVIEPVKKEEPIVVAVAVPVPEGPSVIEHEVKSGETLYRLSRNYHTTVAAIEKENAAKLKNGLTVGLKLTISTKPVVAAANNAGYVTHQVAAGETLTALSRKYNTTVAAITGSNKASLKKGLRAGQSLKILPGEEEEGSNTTVPNNIPPIVGRDKRASSIAEMVIQHQVKTGETLIGLASQYNTTVDDIITDNKSQLDSGLQPGQVLKIKEKNVKETIMAGRQD